MVTPTLQEFLDYRDTLLTVQVRATLDKNPSIANSDATFSIFFDLSEVDYCLTSFISPIDIDPVTIVKTDPRPVEFFLPKINDAGSKILAKTPGLKTLNCGTFTVSQNNLFDFVTKSKDFSGIKAYSVVNDSLFEEEQSLSLTVTSDDYPNHIEPYDFKVSISLLSCGL